MLIEIILGERAPGAEAPIQYSVVNEGFRATINGEAVFEPVAPLRERFAKLKARDNLLGAILARLGLKTSDADDAPKVVARLLEDRNEAGQQADIRGAVLNRIAQGLGLSATKPDELAAQVLAMNTELTSALSSSQAEVKALTEENARLRAEVEQERTAKLRAMTAADIAISRSAELERKIMELKAYLRAAGLNRARAEAKAVGLAAELDAAWTFIELHTGELRP